MPAPPAPELRAARHAALGDPLRLAIVDALHGTDRTPHELADDVGISSNLLAHHLDVLERVDLVERSRSSGDGRRRYVHLRTDAFAGLLPAPTQSAGAALFVCTANSARSQLAAALWHDMTGAPAASAGTEPADTVHPGAIAAAKRHGLDLSDATPRPLPAPADFPPLVVTVCDRAHETVGTVDGFAPHRHWSIPDPVTDGHATAFDRAIDELRNRIATLIGTGTRT